MGGGNLASAEQNVQPGLLLVLSGPAGAGKTTVGDALLRRQSGIERVVTATTRAPRGSEQAGVDYHFWSHAEFERARGLGALLEWAQVHGQLYGTPKVEVDRLLERGLVALLIIDVDGAAQVRALGLDALFVFLDVADAAELEKRLRGRATEDEAKVQKRLARVERERAEASRYDARVLNREVEAAAEDVWRLVCEKRRELASRRPAK
jgi:guanylate kinase